MFSFYLTCNLDILPNTYFFECLKLPTGLRTEYIGLNKNNCMITFQTSSVRTCQQKLIIHAKHIDCILQRITASHVVLCTTFF